MDSRRLKYPAALLATAALLLVAACATTLEPTNYYVLGISKNPKETVSDKTFPFTLAVDYFDSQPILLQRRILWRKDNQVGYYSREKWAELPSYLFSYRLYQRAAGSNLFRHVILGTSSDTDLVLTGKVIAFEEMDEPEGWFGKVEVAAELLNRDGALLWSGTVGHTEQAAERSVQSVIDAIANATEATITSLLSSVEQVLEKSEENENAFQAPPRSGAFAAGAVRE